MAIEPEILNGRDVTMGAEHGIPSDERNERAIETIIRRPEGNIVKGLFRTGLKARGFIKIGRKGAARQKRDNTGTYNLPEKLSYFVVTTLERDRDGINFLRDDKIHEIVGDRPTEIPIRLLYNDPEVSFRTELAAFDGKSRWCTGNGQTALRDMGGGQFATIQCPCERLKLNRITNFVVPKDGRICKANGKLQVLIEGAPAVGGCWEFHTTGENSIEGIQGSLDFLFTATRGHVAGIPMRLKVGPKATTTPEGAPTTIYYVWLEYAGTMRELQHEVIELTKLDANYFAKIEKIEMEARRAPSPFAVQDDEEIAEEFYPDQANKPDEHHQQSVNGAAKTGKVELKYDEPAQHANDSETQRSEPAKQGGSKIEETTNKTTPTATTAAKEPAKKQTEEIDPSTAQPDPEEEVQAAKGRAAEEAAAKRNVAPNQAHTGPALSQGHINLLKKMLQNAKLIESDDAIINTMSWLSEKFGLELEYDDQKLADENLVTMLRKVAISKVGEVRTAIQEKGKEVTDVSQ